MRIHKIGQGVYLANDRKTLFFDPSQIVGYQIRKSSSFATDKWEDKYDILIHVEGGQLLVADTEKKFSECQADIMSVMEAMGSVEQQEEE